MSQKVENSEQLFRFSFTCPRTLNNLHISSCRVPCPDVMPVDFQGPSKFQLEGNEGTGDSNNNYQDLDTHPYDRQTDGFKVYEPNNGEMVATEGNMPEMHNSLTVDFRTTCNRNDMKIRYTRQYLLKFQRSPLAKVFPNDLLKYVSSDEVFLKKVDQEASFYGCGRMDHILFYSSLPYTRKKDSVANCPWRKNSI